jgi:hypothetical protein
MDPWRSLARLVGNRMVLRCIEHLHDIGFFSTFES